MTSVWRIGTAWGIIAALSAFTHSSETRSIVPDVVKMTHSEAEAELAKAGITTHKCKRDDGVEGHGPDKWKVIDQEPEAGAELDLTEIVILTVSDPGGLRALRKKKVPDVAAGKPLAHPDAVVMLEKEGFKNHACYDTSGKKTEPPKSGSKVISYSPKEADLNEVIMLTVQEPGRNVLTIVLVVAGVLLLGGLVWWLSRRAR